MRVLFRPVAEDELAETWDHYESIDPRLADDFLAKVDAAMLRVTANPEAYELVHRELRCVPLRRFPHLLVYRIVEDMLIVVACTHPRQTPRRWRHRR